MVQAFGLLNDDELNYVLPLFLTTPPPARTVRPGGGVVIYYCLSARLLPVFGTSTLDGTPTINQPRAMICGFTFATVKN